VKLKDHAIGKWKLIISELVGPEYTNTAKHQACPNGHGKDCFRLSDKDGNGNFFCKCSTGDRDGFDLLMCVNGWDFATAAKKVEEIIGKADGEPELPKKEHWIWGYARAAKSLNKNSRYLLNRGLFTPHTLRWHPELPYTEEGRVVSKHPAMLAPIVKGDRVLAWHVTYLENGGKASVATVRKILGGSNLRGGAVRLARHEGVLGVAEGIETALAAHQLCGVPTWACLNTSLLEGFEVPEGVSKIVIFGDNDRNFAGHAAAYRLAHRLAGKGVAVDLRFPVEPGTDWNDELMSELERAEKHSGGKRRAIR
jgi:putative DNA primase/helicase